MLGAVRSVLVKSVVRSSLLRPRFTSSVISTNLRCRSIRSYASYSNSDADAKEEPLDRVAQIANSLRENPEIRVLLEQFQELLQKKGFDSSKTPSMFEMVKLMTQSDVKEHIKKLKTSMDAANIKFSPEDIQAFMNFYKNQK